MSLNTLKGAARELETGTAGADGWKTLDALRKEVRKLAIGDETPGRVKRKPTPIEVAREKNRTLNAALEGAIRYRALYERAYLELLRLARQAARSSPEMSERIRRHVATFGEIGIRAVKVHGND